MRILIAEDDPVTRKLLRKTLEDWGYEVLSAENGQKALEIYEHQNVKFIIADWMMPEMDGLSLCRMIRSKKDKGYAYFIILTGRDRKEDIIEGLKMGADDYVTKPFSIRELLARIKAVLRRGEDRTQSKDKNNLMKIGKIEIDFSSYNAFEDGLSVQMSHKEFEILNFLWNRKNSTVSRDDLLNSVWGYDESPTTRTVDNFILKLRQKIEKDPNHPKIILTVHGIGYKLID